MGGKELIFISFPTPAASQIPLVEMEKYFLIFSMKDSIQSSSIHVAQKANASEGSKLATIYIHVKTNGMKSFPPSLTCQVPSSIFCIFCVSADSIYKMWSNPEPNSPYSGNPSLKTTDILPERGLHYSTIMQELIINFKSTPATVLLFFKSITVHSLRNQGRGGRETDRG